MLSLQVKMINRKCLGFLLKMANVVGPFLLGPKRNATEDLAIESVELIAICALRSMQLQFDNPFPLSNSPRNRWFAGNDIYLCRLGTTR